MFVHAFAHKKNPHQRGLVVCLTRRKQIKHINWMKTILLVVMLAKCMFCENFIE